MTVLINQNLLSDMLAVSMNVLRTYLGHFTLAKYVKHIYNKNVRGCKYRATMFELSPDSIYAMQEYLKLKMRYGKSKKNYTISGIEKLKEYYESNKGNKGNKQNDKDIGQNLLFA